IGTITSPTAFHAANVQKNLAPQITTVLSEILAKQVDLEFKVGEPILTANKPMPLADTLNAGAGSSSGSGSNQSSPQAPNQASHFGTHTSNAHTQQPGFQHTQSFSSAPQQEA